MNLLTRPLMTARLRSSAQMGVVALRIAAVLLGTVRSPQAKKVKGIALLKSATRKSQKKSLRGGSECLPTTKTTQSSAAPKAERSSATQTGGKLFPAMLMRRNDIPQTAASRRI